MPRKYQCGPNWTFDLQLRDYDLWFVHKGQGKMDVRGQSVALHPGSTVVLAPGDHAIARQDPDRPIEVTAFHFEMGRSSLTSTLQKRLLWNVGHPQRLAGWLEQMVTLAAVEQDWQPVCDHLLACILWELVRPRACGVEKGADYRLKILAADIRANPATAWTIDRLCHKLGVGRTVLHNLFQSTFGTTPARFVIRARIDLAELLLITTRLTVYEVAEAVGYRDVFYFSRQFKAWTGESPMRFRRSRK